MSTSVPDTIECSIYKGRRKVDTYLYVETSQEFARVPESLIEMFGELSHVMDVALNEARALANADVNDVMRSLHETGYYVQMPPPEDSPNRLPD